jgi:hypothetical protein
LSHQFLVRVVAANRIMQLELPDQIGVRLSFRPQRLDSDAHGVGVGGILRRKARTVTLLLDAFLVGGFLIGVEGARPPGSPWAAPTGICSGGQKDAQ